MPLNRRETVIHKAMSVGKGLLGERFAIVQSLPFVDLVLLTEANAHPAGIGVSVTSDGIDHSTSVWHNSSK